MRVLRSGIRTVAAAVVAVLLLTVPAKGATGVITTKVDEFYPAATDTYIAWNIWDGKHAVVYAKQFGGSKWRVSPRGTDAWVGSIDGTTLTYQQAVFSKGRSDIYAYDLVAKTRHKIGSPVSTSRWEYDANSSGDWIMYARYYRNADRKVLLYNTNTHETRHLAATSGRPWNLRPGQVSGNYAVWEKNEVRHRRLKSCNVFLYDIAGDTTTKITNPDNRCQYAPAVNPAGTVYFGRSGFGCGRNAVIRQQPLGSSASLLVKLRDGYDVYSPYAVDNGDTTTDVYYDPFRCGHQADIVKVTDP